MKRGRQHIDRPHQKLEKIVIPSLKGFVVIDVSTIVRLESSGKYTTFFLSNGNTESSSKSLKDYSQMLESEGFFRVHQTHLVNLDFVRSFENEGTVKLEGNHAVPVSSRKKKEFVQAMTSHR